MQESARAEAWLQPIGQQQQPATCNSQRQQQPATCNSQRQQQPATCNSQRLQQQLTAAAAYNNSSLQQQSVTCNSQRQQQPATCNSQRPQQQLTAAAAYSNNNPQQQLDAEPHSQHRGRSNIVTASDDFAVSTEDAVTHQECLFITSNICMQGAQYLEKRRKIILL